MKNVTVADMTIRIMREDDLDSIIEIDRLISSKERAEFFRGKLVSTLSRTEHLVTSLVAELEGRVVGFVMGNVYLGEFGVPETKAYVDTVGIAPDCQRMGIAHTLMEKLEDQLRTAGVKTILTRVEWDDWGLLRFFANQGFSPSPVVSLSKEI